MNDVYNVPRSEGTDDTWDLRVVDVRQNTHGIFLDQMVRIRKEVGND